MIAPPTGLPTSFGQQRLWILDKLERAGAAYNVPLLVRVDAALNQPALERALTALATRHETLRTTFAIENSEVRQLVHDTVPVAVQQVDLRGQDTALQEETWRQRAAADAATPFDLEVGPLWRVTRFELDDSTNLLAITIHHIIFDGWSEGILVRDLEALYAVETAGPPLRLPELPVQYADFAAWQREHHTAESGASDLTFWTGALAGAPTTLALPTDRRPNPARRFTGSTRTLTIDRTTADTVRAIAREERTTTFAVLLAAFSVVLSRYTDQDDMVIGVPVSGRGRPEVADLIGFFVNTVLLRVRVGSDVSGRTLLSQVRERVADVLGHQVTPFERVLETTRTAEGRFTLQVLFAVDQRADLRTGSAWRSEVHEIRSGTAKVDLALGIVDDETFTITAEYADALFDAGTIDAFLVTFACALDAIATATDSKVADWDLLASADRKRLINEWSGRVVATSDPVVGVDQHFDRIATASPERNAVVCEDDVLTYGQLQSRADAIASRLEGLVAQGDVVGVVVDRSTDYIAALLGILKAGAAYLPIDPGYPPSRIALMLSDASARVVVGRSNDALGLSAGTVWLDPASATLGSRVPCRSRASDLAYVLYTSGSTGTPKGVAIQHGSIVRLVRDVDYVSLGPDERVLHLSAGSFDLSTFEIWGALLNGGCVVVAPTTTPTFRQLRQLIREGGVTTMWLTSTFFNTVIDSAPGALSPLRQLLVGGEALSLVHVRRALELLPHVTLINGYGPTEATVFAASYRIPSDLSESSKSVPIGRPLPGTQLFILDRHGRLAPQGAPGELHIGGTGVARGYFNRPVETARAFVTGAIPELPDERVYRSGDLARWRADGTLEFLGRDDGQVKLRGFRIELGEIEAAIRTHPDVDDAAATLKPGRDGSPRLVAYIVTVGNRVAPEALQAYLRSRLPDYMMPTAFVAIDSLPRTRSGKLDRQALPEPPAQVRQHSRAAPASENEVRVHRIFQNVLGTADVGIEEDFFGLGGHSLLAIQLFSEIEREFGLQLPLHRLTSASSVRALAGEIERAQPVESARRVPGVSLLREGHGPYAVYIPFSVGGDLLFCSQLVSKISTDVPVWGLTPPEGIDQTNMQALANAIADRMQSHAPAGRYTLAGYSFSGMLAYETAVELERRGQEIPLVAVIDSGPPVAPSISRTLKRPLRVLKNLPNWLRDDIFASSPSALAGRIRRKLGAWSTRSERILGTRTTDAAAVMFEDMYGGQEVAEEYRHLVEQHLRALLTHRPGRFRGRLVAFRAKTRPFLHSLDPDLGWHTYVDGAFEIVAVPCHHDNVLRSPHVDSIARDLSERIARLPRP